MKSNVYNLAEKRDSKKNYSPAKLEKDKKKSSEELAKLSTIDISNCKTNVDFLVAIQKMLFSIIPIAEGLYRERPGQSNAYSLTNLIEKYQNVSEQIEEQVDLEDLGHNIMSDLIRPIIESMVIELGILFKDERSKLKSKKVSESFDRVFQSYGKLVEDKLNTLEQDLINFME